MAGGGDPNEDTIIGVTPPALVEPMEDGSSGADADTVIGEGRSAEPRPRPVADAPSGGAGPGAGPEPVGHPEEPGHPVSFIRIGSHEPIPLDVPAYIGRRPSSPRITGGRLPRLVMVPSPSREVSSTHLEIRQEGPTVVVTDLGSTNGTVVTNPLGPPVKLRQGESVVVVDGSIVDIGDGIRVVIVPGTGDQSAEGHQ
ncbi:MAG TPA: FHA domain-containing protein [Terrimesophilobacter sp.]|nr:FHA domain-containing protein [Terrimesophilobacter sp.]